MIEVVIMMMMMIKMLEASLSLSTIFLSKSPGWCQPVLSACHHMVIDTNIHVKITPKWLGRNIKKHASRGSQSAQETWIRLIHEIPLQGLSTDAFLVTSHVEYLTFKKRNYQILKCYITQKPVYRHYTTFYFIIIIITYTCATFLAFFSGGGSTKCLEKYIKLRKGKVRPQKYQLRATNKMQKKRNQTQHISSTMNVFEGWGWTESSLPKRTGWIWNQRKLS